MPKRFSDDTGADYTDAEIAKLRAALELIRDTPYCMVNDSESLRHSCRVMTDIATKALG